jgi:hypothetical protein
MAVFIGAIGNVRSSRYIDENIVKFIDSLNKEQLKKMRKALVQEMRLTYNKQNKQRYQSLKKELEYINYRLS